MEDGIFISSKLILTIVLKQTWKNFSKYDLLKNEVCLVKLIKQFRKWRQWDHPQMYIASTMN